MVRILLRLTSSVDSEDRHQRLHLIRTTLLDPRGEMSLDTICPNLQGIGRTNGGTKGLLLLVTTTSEASTTHQEAPAAVAEGEEGEAVCGNQLPAIDPPEKETNGKQHPPSLLVRGTLPPLAAAREVTAGPQRAHGLHLQVILLSPKQQSLEVQQSPVGPPGADQEVGLVGFSLTWRPVQH